MTCSSYSPAKLIHDFKRLTAWLSVRLLLCCVCILNCASLINKYIILYQPPYKIDISLVYLTFANMGKNKNTANAFSTNCICKLLFFPCLSTCLTADVIFFFLALTLNLFGYQKTQKLMQNHQHILTILRFLISLPKTFPSL